MQQVYLKIIFIQIENLTFVPSYDEWFESNAEFFGNNESFIRAVRENLQIEGMQEGGFAADLRKAITDLAHLMTDQAILTLY